MNLPWKSPSFSFPLTLQSSSAHTLRAWGMPIRLLFKQRRSLQSLLGLPGQIPEMRKGRVTGAGVAGDHRDTAWGAEELVSVPVQEESVCKCFWSGGKDEKVQREEEKQAQAGVNELCWIQLQLDNL